MYPGIHALRFTTPDWLRHKRVGLLSHPAALDADGVHAETILLEKRDIRLECLLGPEHGYFGWGGAGEHIFDHKHPWLKLPVHSLYGDQRIPGEDILDNLQALVIDLQDLGFRCYTYVSTLRNVLETANRHGLVVAVADRPIAYPNLVDGALPNLADPGFVCHAPVPFAYGMTPGETARFLVRSLGLTDLELHVLPMQGYHRQPGHQWRGHPWTAPSPAIHSWQAAYAYPVTVFAESMPHFLIERHGLRPFRILGDSDLKVNDVLGLLAKRPTPGITWHRDTTRKPNGLAAPALRLEVTDPGMAKPVRASIELLATLRDVMGDAYLWDREGIRPDFFDQLMGTTWIREGLRNGDAASEIIRAVEGRQASFHANRRSSMIYAGA